jgi:gluconokinase
MTEKPIVVVMGVCGCGKSLVARLLAERLGCAFVEGDDLHPPANVGKMSAGIPLTDEDRAGWLAVLADRLAEAHDSGVALTLSCSALRRAYRDRLRGQGVPVIFLHLHGSKQLIEERMSRRGAHFMPRSLIDSQFAALEEPGPDELALRYEITWAPEDVVADALCRMPIMLKAAIDARPARC